MKGAEELLPETAPVAEPLLEAAQERARPRRPRLVGKWAFKLAAMAAATSAVVASYAIKTDIDEMHTLMANTKPYITENSEVPETDSEPLPVPRGVYETMDHSEQLYIDTMRHVGGLAVINFSGFGRTTMPEGAKTYGPFNKIGANWSMNYDPAGIDAKVMARTIEVAIRSNPHYINRLGFIGNSAGTAIETDVAANFARIDPDVDISFVLMDSPAVARAALRKKPISDGNALLNTVDLPGVKYSRWARWAADVYLLWDRVKSIGSFFKLLAEEHKEVFDDKHPLENTLLADEYREINGPMVHDDLATLGNLPPEKRPLIFFMGAADPKQDDVVNVTASYKLVKKWTGEAGLTLVGPIGIKDFHHGEPYRSMDQYHSAFTKQIIPKIVNAQEDRRHSGEY